MTKKMSAAEQAAQALDIPTTSGGVPRVNRNRNFRLVDESEGESPPSETALLESGIPPATPAVGPLADVESDDSELSDPDRKQPSANKGGSKRKSGSAQVAAVDALDALFAAETSEALPGASVQTWMPIALRDWLDEEADRRNIPLASWIACLVLRAQKEVAQVPAPENLSQIENDVVRRSRRKRPRVRRH